MANYRKATQLIADKPILSDAARTDLAKKIEARKAEDMRKVRGIFKNLECPNGCVKFSTRKYKGEPVGNYLFWDNKEYEVPLYVAKHLNNNCSYPVHAHTLDSEGNPTTSVGKMVNRFAFISTEFR